MNLNFFMITFNHMPDDVRSILSVLFILTSLILITYYMSFSIAKPFITIFAFADDENQIQAACMASDRIIHYSSPCSTLHY